MHAIRHAAMAMLSIRAIPESVEACAVIESAMNARL
jgi:hypothetical protein